MLAGWQMRLQCKYALQKSADTVLKAKTKAESKKAQKLGLGNVLSFQLSRVAWCWVSSVLMRAEAHEFISSKKKTWEKTDLAGSAAVECPPISPDTSYTLAVWSLHRAQVSVYADSSTCV